ncbi:Stk1 family PASTA domain-containing Ser/Thr kinase [Sanguibacter antarcticus]|uniref:non-specific serine/threonine protein kinase n=1 Tax=Sanguibacter antarcticus TaxID=372484 RepID=A0A2A9E3J0_9MICO|nr:Stk1 family PASTA domain-containing Ser/Thr kinase [Sanguibacter antarcticus]PFG32925.1 serine/threonine-protein kinase [Sanguibacter antarcticus]
MATILSDSLVGQLVDGRYKILSRIARGGMATVYLATDRRLDREVALKVMHSHLADGATGADFVSRFRREARAAARLTHPGLVAVYDQGVDGETSYLTMEYVDGTNLRRRLHDDGPFTVDESLSIIDDILDALAAAHRKNLVHRDIKPENVLLATDGRVKVADFGLARAVTEVTSTTTGTILGTVAYLGPELISTGACDTRTDIYAVGVMLYEMLTGRQPFVGSTPIQVAFLHVNNDIPRPSELVDWIPAELDQLVCAMAAREPADRPADAPAALELLRTVRAGLSDDLVARRAAAPAPVVFLAEGTPSDEDPQDDDLDDATTALPDLPTLEPGDETFDAGPAHAAASRTARTPEPENATQALNVGASGSTIALPLGTARSIIKNSSAGGAPAAAPDSAADGTPTTSTVALEVPAPKRRRRGLVGAIITIVLLLAVLGGGSYWWFVFGPGNYTTVPEDLVEVSLADAESALTVAALGIESTEAFSDTVASGVVIAADPESGAKIAKDGTVELTVSKGIEHFTVPKDLTGIADTDSETALEAAGFTAVSTTLVWDTTVAEGTVMSISEAEGALLPHNTPIVLTVSKGPEPVTVPQVQLLSLDDATQQLAPWDLAPVTVEEYSETVPEGSVIAQSPEQGTAAHRGDEITLTVSLGRPFVEVPDVLLKPVAEAQKLLEDAGFVVKVNYYFGVFGNEVRSQSEDAGTQLRKGSTITLDL